MSERTSRIAACGQHFRLFTGYYLEQYIKSTVPDFHGEIYIILQAEGGGFVEIIAFRGSAKSTLVSLALPLWAALYKKRNFIILISNTFAQAKQLISNIIHELENNERIK